jgi:hypothetical protein
VTMAGKSLNESTPSPSPTGPPRTGTGTPTVGVDFEEIKYFSDVVVVDAGLETHQGAIPWLRSVQPPGHLRDTVRPRSGRHARAEPRPDDHRQRDLHPQ